MTYSVVVNEGISSVIHTDSDGAQQIIALDVTTGYADKIAYLLNLTDESVDQIVRLLRLTDSNAWGREFDDRQMKEIKFSCLYARDFKHGTDGHNAKLIISKFVEILERKQ